MTTLTFLGTGGGRFATIYQVRSTGGLYIYDKQRLHVDPGPSALWMMGRAGLDPAKTDVLLISHCHPDHYSDAEVLLEGMTRGGLKKRGMLVGSRSAIKGLEGFGPAVSAYHQSLVPEVRSVQAGDVVGIGAGEIKVTPSKHSDPSGVGFIIPTSDGAISYVSDTELDSSVVNAHAGSRVLILPLTRGRGARVPNHISTEDAVEFTRKVSPEIVLLTHFGAKLIRQGAGAEAEFIEKETGVRTVAADDLMTVRLGKKIVIKGDICA
jgi:phosphoribosyl 1,2-cyclic phosphodiesterase